MTSTIHQLMRIFLAFLLIARCTSFSLSPGARPTIAITTTPPPPPSSAASSSSPLKATPVQTNNHEPIILSLPNIISTHQITEMLQTIETSQHLKELVPTESYQEDVFSKDAWGQEDALFRSIVQPLVDDHLIPSEYLCTVDLDLENENENEKDSNCNPDPDPDPDAALQMFVYAVTKHQDRMKEEDIILGANIIQRRQAVERWKSEEGQAVMQLSLDPIEDGANILDEQEIRVDVDAMSLGKRYKIPSSLLSQLQQLIPLVLKGSWVIRDATLVQYNEGDSQVPHIDPCDATLLICLKSCEKGGATCFPMLEQPRRLENRAGFGLLFFSSNAIAGDGSRDVLSLHHGGKVMKGEKVVVQLMLDWAGYGQDGGDEFIHQEREEDDASHKGSWLDVIACL